MRRARLMIKPKVALSRPSTTTPKSTPETTEVSKQLAAHEPIPACEAPQGAGEKPVEKKVLLAQIKRPRLQSPSTTAQPQDIVVPIEEAKKLLVVEESFTIEPIIPNDQICARPAPLRKTSSVTSTIDDTEESSDSHTETLRSLPSRGPPRAAIRKTETRELMTASRRKFCNVKEPIDTSKLTMLDLLYYNPPGAPMKRKSAPPPVAPTVEDVQESLEPELEEQSNVGSPGKAEEDEEEVLGPRVVVGPDGQIQIDEASLVIRRPNPLENKHKLKVTVEEAGKARYDSFKTKKMRKCTWTASETAKFYKALSICGTDFTMMTRLLPSRSRQDLKNKFKREEKINPFLIDKAIQHPTQFEFTEIELEDISKDDAGPMPKKTRGPRAAAKPGRTKTRKTKTDESQAIQIQTSENNNDIETSVQVSPNSSSRPRRQKARIDYAELQEGNLPIEVANEVVIEEKSEDTQSRVPCSPISIPHVEPEPVAAIRPESHQEEVIETAEVRRREQTPERQPEPLVDAGAISSLPDEPVPIEPVAVIVKPRVAVVTSSAVNNPAQKRIAAPKFKSRVRKAPDVVPAPKKLLPGAKPAQTPVISKPSTDRSLSISEAAQTVKKNESEETQLEEQSSSVSLGSQTGLPSTEGQQSEAPSEERKASSRSVLEKLSETNSASSMSLESTEEQKEVDSPTREQPSVSEPVGERFAGPKSEENHLEGPQSEKKGFEYSDIERARQEGTQSEKGSAVFKPKLEVSILEPTARDQSIELISERRNDELNKEKAEIKSNRMIPTKVQKFDSLKADQINEIDTSQANDSVKYTTQKAADTLIELRAASSTESAKIVTPPRPRVVLPVRPVLSTSIVRPIGASKPKGIILSPVTIRKPKADET